MSTQRRGVEFLVGLFLIIGFGVIVAMVLIFGRVGQGFQNRYPITVEFPNASGLVKGCDVLLSGAKVGTVTEAPRLTGQAYAVAAAMRIKPDVHIPTKSIFVIRTSGMLGDSYVDVVPPRQFDPDDFIQPGQTISGSRASGLDELTAKGGKMMDTLNQDILLKINRELDEIHIATKSINSRLLSEKNLQNLEETLANLKTTSAGFAQTLKTLDLAMTKTSVVIDSAAGTMKSVDGVAGDARLAIADFRKVTTATEILIKKTTNGEGALGALISDKQTAENLKSLIANLRRSGVIFYKDAPLPPPISRPVPSTPAPQTPRRSR